MTPTPELIKLIPYGLVLLGILTAVAKLWEVEVQ